MTFGTFGNICSKWFKDWEFGVGRLKHLRHLGRSGTFVENNLKIKDLELVIWGIWDDLEYLGTFVENG